MGGITDARDALEFIIAGATRRAGRHRQLRRSVHLVEAARRTRRLRRRHAIQRAARTLSAPPTRTQSKTCMNPLLAALDVDAATTATTLAERLRGHVGGFKVGSHLFTAEGPPFVRALVAARRSRLPRSQVPRHPEHGRERRARRGAARRVDAQCARERRPRDDARCTRRRAPGRTRTGIARWSSRSRCSPASTARRSPTSGSSGR